MKGISGRSMIEMLGVLAIIGVLSAGGIFAYSTAMENYKTNKLIDDISHIASGARGIFLKYRKVSETNRIRIPELYRLGIIPEEYHKNYNASTFMTKSPWNTKMDIRVTEWTNGLTDIYFHINQVPYATCVKFATFPWNITYPKSTFMTYAQAGGYYTGSLGCKLLLPLTRSLAEEYCAAGGGKTVAIQGSIAFSSQ